jgi:hypothetical protein
LLALPAEVSAQSNIIQETLDGVAVSKTKIRKKPMSDGYYDLNFSQRTCDVISYVKANAEIQSRSSDECKRNPFCLKVGNYKVAILLEVSHRALADRPVSLKKGLWIDGSNIDDNARTVVDCSIPIAVAIPEDEPLEIKIEAAGALESYNFLQLLGEMEKVVQTVGLAVSVFRPALGGRIVAGNQYVNVDGNALTLDQVNENIKLRAKALNEFFSKLSASTGVRKTRKINIGINDQDVELYHGKETLLMHFTKTYRWTVLADREGSEQKDRKFRTSGFGGLTSNIDRYLTSSIGVDTKAIKDSIDVSLDRKIASDDPAVVMGACQSVISSLEQSLQPHDVLAFVWRVAYVARDAREGPPCFTRLQKRDLEKVGLAEPPYPGAYTHSHVANLPGGG